MVTLISLALSLAAASDTLVGVYWVCLIVGGGMLLVSVLGGIGHGDVDVGAGGADFHVDAGHFDAGAGAGDVHVDVGHADSGGGDLGHADTGHAGGTHAHAAHAGLSTWFSVRFVIFFMAVFGAFGLVMTRTSASAPTAFIVALLAGVAVGQSVHQIFRAIRRGAGNSLVAAGEYINRLGRVTIGIDGGQTGEVAVQVRGGERYVPAVARGGQTRFATGDEIVVVAYRGGVAEVVSRSEFARTR